MHGSTIFRVVLVWWSIAHPKKLLLTSRQTTGTIIKNLFDVGKSGVQRTFLGSSATILDSWV